MEKTKIYIQRAPKESDARYVALSASGDLLMAAAKLSDISERWRLIDSHDSTELIRQLDKTWQPRKG